MMLIVPTHRITLAFLPARWLERKLTEDDTEAIDHPQIPIGGYMDKREVEILIYENAFRSQREALARAQRRMFAAQDEYYAQRRIFNEMEATLERLRGCYLQQAV